MPGSAPQFEGGDDDRTLTCRCPDCGKRFALSARLEGRRVRCRHCGGAIPVTAEPPPLADELPLAEPPPLNPGKAMRIRTAGPPPSEHPQPAAVDSMRPRPTKVIAIAASCVIAVIAISAYLISRPPGIRTGRSTEASRSDPPAVAPSSGDPRTVPPPPQWKGPVSLAWGKDAAGRAVGTATVSSASIRTDVRLVLPPGEHPAGSLPCVFVCPAGSNMLTGVPFGAGEQADFYGLLDRGLAVCFYSLDGTVKDYDTTPDLVTAAMMTAYLRTGCGTGNLRDAVDAVLAAAPAIDPGRLGTIGHSSAGTVALEGAGFDGRVTAAAAMAPIVDVPLRLGEFFDLLPADAQVTLRRFSPSSIAALKADVFLFVAEDDDRSPLPPAKAFADKHPGRVTLKRIATGGHGGAYQEGIGPAMDFLAARLRATPPPAAGGPAVRAASVKPPKADAPPGAGGTATAAPNAPAAVPARASAETPQRSVSATPPARRHEVNEAYWTKRRTVGVAFAGDASFLLIGDWPEGYSAGGDRRGGATVQVMRDVGAGKRMGLRVLVVPDAGGNGAARLAAHADGMLPAGAGRVGLDVANRRAVLPKSEPRVLPALGGGQVAVFDCGDDTEQERPTREAVVAFAYDGRTILIHAAVPRENAGELDQLIAGVRAWGVRGNAAAATAYTTFGEGW